MLAGRTEESAVCVVDITLNDATFIFLSPLLRAFLYLTVS